MQERENLRIPRHAGRGMAAETFLGSGFTVNAGKRNGQMEKEYDVKMRQLYEELKRNKKARVFCTAWILYWGMTLGFLLYEKDLIIGTAAGEQAVYETVWIVAVILCICGWIFSMIRFARNLKKTKKARTIGAGMLFPILLNAAFLFFELEYIGNSQLFEMKWYYMLLNTGVIFVFAVLLTGFFNSLKTAMLVLNGFYFIISLVFYYVYLFRGEAFQLIDLFSLGTAAEVVGGYQFEITREMVLMLTATLILFSLWKQSRDHVLIRNGICPKILLRIITALAAGVFYLLYMFLNWNAQFGVISDLWNPAKTYREYGTTVGFLAVAKYMRLTPPEGYSPEEVERIIAETENEGTNGTSGKNQEINTEKPQTVPTNIIVVMNESWFDYRSVGDPMTNEDYMPFLDSLTENIVKGYTLTCTKGGGTAKTEYEFLTGNSCKRFPGMVPYVSYFTHDQYSLVTTLQDQGYKSVAMHPNKATNWKRTTAYRFLNFDDFIAIDRFPENVEKYRNMVSDQANYEEIIRLYEEKEKGQPLFLFDITMQNHSGYTNQYFNSDIICEGYECAEADQYFSLLRLSDQALEYLITYFEQVEEPTMIVMFGDHSPKLPEDFETWIAGAPYEELSIRDQEKFYGTPFFIWTNYEMESKENVWISTNYLSTYLLELAGLQLTPYNEYLQKLREEIPAMNHLGYLNQRGIWRTWENADSDILELVREYECLQYNELKDSQNRVDSFFRIEQEM